MKIAVASSDGTNISPHFGRSSYFLIFDVVNGRIVGKEQRPNTFTAHARGECRGEQTHDHGTHSHASVVEALSDCKAVLCYGMGWRAAEALGREGIQAFVLGEECTPEGAVTLFLDGQLPPASQGFCRGHS
jgi:predicted Fe-Mo cluster-binding NifX family protein